MDLNSPTKDKYSLNTPTKLSPATPPPPLESVFEVDLYEKLFSNVSQSILENSQQNYNHSQQEFAQSGQISIDDPEYENTDNLDESSDDQNEEGRIQYLNENYPDMNIVASYLNEKLVFDEGDSEYENEAYEENPEELTGEYNLKGMKCIITDGKDDPKIIYTTLFIKLYITFYGSSHEVDEDMSDELDLWLENLMDFENASNEIFRYINFLDYEYKLWLSSLPDDFIPSDGQNTLFWVDYFWPEYFKTKRPSKSIIEKIENNKFLCFCPMSVRVFQYCMDVFLEQFFDHILKTYESWTQSHRCIKREYFSMLFYVEKWKIFTRGLNFLGKYYKEALMADPYRHYPGEEKFRLSKLWEHILSKWKSKFFSSWELSLPLLVREMIQKEWNGAERLTLRIPESVIESYKLFGLGGFTKITLKDKRNKPTAFEFYQFICWHRDQFPRILSDLSSKVKVLEDDSLEEYALENLVNKKIHENNSDKNTKTDNNKIWCKTYKRRADLRGRLRQLKLDIELLLEIRKYKKLRFELKFLESELVNLKNILKSKSKQLYELLKEEFQTIGMEFAKLKITKPSGDVTIIEEIDITGKKLTFDNLKQEFDEVLKEFQADKFLYKQSDEDLKQLENMLFLIA